MPDQATLGVTAAVSRTVRNLRQQRELSLVALAERAGISRSMLIQIEKGRTNPSLGVLVRIAAALDVSLTELVAFEQPASARVMPPGSGTVMWRGDHGGEGRMLAGAHGTVQFQVWDWRMGPGDEFSARPQPTGTAEIIHVLEGELELRTGDKIHRVPAGHTVMFLPDRPHGYANRGTGDLRMIISNGEPPSGLGSSKEVLHEGP